jgi:hypothetical protein
MSTPALSPGANLYHISSLPCGGGFRWGGTPLDCPPSPPSPAMGGRSVNAISVLLRAYDMAAMPNCRLKTPSESSSLSSIEIAYFVFQMFESHTPPY